MLNRGRRPLAAVVSLTLLTTQACYAYQPVAASVVPVAGERVRVSLTSEGTTELARYLGPLVTGAEGQISEIRDDGTLVLAVELVEQSSGVRQPWSGEGVVAFPANYRAGLERRTFMRRQTVMTSVALAAALVATAIFALRAGGAEGDPGGGGTPPPP